jgi:hypothetical protein
MAIGSVSFLERHIVIGMVRHKSERSMIVSSEVGVEERRLARGWIPIELQGRVSFVPLLAAGVLVYLGLVLLGGLTGLLWHIYVYKWWIVLNPSLLGPTWDWLVWGASFLVMISPSVLKPARTRAKPDLVLSRFEGVAITDAFYKAIDAALSA